MPLFDETTPHKGYPLPHCENYLNEDVERLRDAVTAIDEDINGISESVGDTLQESLQEINDSIDQLQDDLTQATDTLNDSIGSVTNSVEALRIQPIAVFPPETETIPLSAGRLAIIRDLGLFEYDAASDDPADRETCFAATGTDGAVAAGKWLMVLPAVDFTLTLLHDEAAYAEMKRDEIKEQAVHALTATASLNFGSVAAAASVDRTMAIAGAEPGDACIVAPPALVAGLDCWAWISAAGTATVRVTNTTAAAITLAAANFTVKALKEGIA